MEEVKKTAEELQLVIFRLSSEEYGLPITKVQEINRVVPVTKLPQTPSFMEGIINLRGRVIPVIDLRKRFGLTEAAHTDDTRIIIVEVDGQTVGATVDAVTEVVRIPSAQVDPPPPSFILDAEYIHGVAKMEGRLIILLNIDKILTSQETIAIKQLQVN